MSDDPLSGLRDIHLPPDPTFWPPAPGWWVLAAASALLAAALVVHRRREVRRRRPQREALHALAALREALLRGERPDRVVAGSSSLLRRAALSKFPREQVAGLTGREWLAFLSTHGGGPEFVARGAEQLVTAPYTPGAEVDAEEVLKLCERWISRNW